MEAKYNPIRIIADSKDDFVDEDISGVEIQSLPEKSSAKQEKQNASKESSTKEAQVNGAKAQSTGDVKSVLIKEVSQKGTQIEAKITETNSSVEIKPSPVMTADVSHAKSDIAPTEEESIQPMTYSPNIEVMSTLPHQTTTPSVQIKLNKNLLADKLASPPKDIKQDVAPNKLAETSKDQSSGMFHRLRNFFGLTRTDGETKTESSLTASRALSSETKTLTHTPEISKLSSQSPRLSAVDAIISAPSSLRHLTPPIAESESLYSAAKLAPPTINAIVRTSDSRGQHLSLPNFYKVALFPSTIPQTSQSLQDHYTRQVRIHKPDGMSDFEIRQILGSWLKIENWSSEELNETSMRQVVRMTLSSAFEIMEVRKKEQQIRKEEKLAGQSKGDETEEKVWYPLTEHSSSTNETKDRKMGESRTLERKMKEKSDSTNVKLEDEMFARKIDDKQLAEVKSDSKELPTKSVNKNANENDDKLSGMKESVHTNDSHTIETPGIPPVAAEQIFPSHGANP